MSKILKSNSMIEEKEIYFEEEIIAENKEISAYISIANIDLEEKFGLKYENDMYYDMYLNYKYLENKLYIEIIRVEDEKKKLLHIYTCRRREKIC